LICARVLVSRMGATGTVGFFGDLKEGTDFLRHMVDTLTAVGMVMVVDILTDELVLVDVVRGLRRRSEGCVR